MSYAVLSTGHHVREVMNADLAAVNYSYLEYRLITVASSCPPTRATRSSGSEAQEVPSAEAELGRFAAYVESEKGRDAQAAPVVRP